MKAEIKGSAPVLAIKRRMSEYGMLGVLLLLCAFFSFVTLKEQHPVGAAAAKSVAEQLIDSATNAGSTETSVIIVARGGEDDQQFVNTLSEKLENANITIAGIVVGDPASVRQTMEQIAGQKDPAMLVIATLESYAPVAHNVAAAVSGMTAVPVITPRSYRWPTFLLGQNLLNVANQIAVIAILAIGMTMVIITAGIDLSVGSLIALSAVVVAWLIGLMGGAEASVGAVILAGAGAITFAGLVGAFSAGVITRFRVPPFIATLGMMQVASGLAYIISRGRPIYQVPDSFVTLGRGVDQLLGIPYAVLLMVSLYGLAYLMMSRTSLGRHIYAVGGNEEAARLSGVRVKGVLVFVYILNAALAGLGGVLMASQLKSGAPTYGMMYELYVIAAVVVGGTSLSGGEGKILGTLIGAFIIAVIQNGMNLTNVESYTQKVVLGLVILGAVLLDRLKQSGWKPGRN